MDPLWIDLTPSSRAISRIALLAFATLAWLMPPPAPASTPEFLGGTFYVATDGDDTTGNGSLINPWATITQALDSVADQSLILVRPGTYSGQVPLRGTFPVGVTVRSEVPYAAKLRHDDTVVTAYANPDGVEGITLEGFDIAHEGPDPDPYVVHVDGNGNVEVSRIVLRGNILHDSQDNAILRIANSTRDITVEGNLFFNASGGDDYLDLNSVEDIVVQDNIFLGGSTFGGITRSFVVVKDTSGNLDLFVGSRRVLIRRNIFLDWNGAADSFFVLLGDHGLSIYEAEDITVENNLMLGNSTRALQSPFGVKAGRDILFRFNTVVGDLPSRAFAMRLYSEGLNPVNDNIQFFGNVWSDPTGTMGANDGDSNDFSDTPPDETTSVTLSRNAYWNGGDALPEDPSELVNPSDDSTAVIGNPLLRDQAGLVVPYWDSDTETFADGSASIREAFVRLANLYGTPASGSVIINAGAGISGPADDLLGNPRSDGQLDLGAVEVSPLFANGFEGGDVSGWDASTP